MLPLNPVARMEPPVAETFHVNLSGLRSLWSKTTSLASISQTNSERVFKYAFPPLTSSGTGAYIDMMQPGLKNTWGQAERFAAGTAKAIAYLAKNIDAARSLYSSSDDRATARFDALVDDIGTPDRMIFSGRPKPDPKSHADDLGCTWPEDPAIREGAPQSNPDYKFSFDISTGDLLKPTAYVRKALSLIWENGEDPVGFFLKMFLGDWDQLYKSGVEFERYAKSFGRMGRSIQFLADQVPVVWSGQASKNAREQMIVLGQKIAKSESDFAEVANVFKTTSNDAYTAYVWISDKIDDFINSLVPVAGEINAVRNLSRLTGHAADVARLGKTVYEALVSRTSYLDSKIKAAKALPESLTLPTPQINGYSVTLGGWWKSSKQGPY